MKNKKDNISFRLTVDKKLWQKFKATIPLNMTINQAIIMLIIERVKKIWGDEWDK
ncbi:MAG: hypothetical protein QW734_03740 [Candidatus Bathyarchaeia archaeon]